MDFREKTCCFSGHRSLSHEEKLKVAVRLRKIIEEQIKAGVVHVSREYTSDCMHRRNRHLVDYSGTCISYLMRSSGGTAYTVDYARKKGLHVINIANDF